MKKSSRLLSFLLAVVMVVSLMPTFTITAAAEDTIDYNESWSVTMPAITQNPYMSVVYDVQIPGQSTTFNALKSAVDTGDIGNGLQYKFLSASAEIAGVSTIYAILMIEKKADYTSSDSLAIPNYTSGSAPWGNQTINMVFIEDGITAIGNYAFNNQSNLTRADIPMSVTSIGQYAFANDIRLQSAKLWRVTTLGQYAFYNCPRIGGDVAIGTADDDAVTATTVSVGNYAMHGVSGITSLVIGSDKTVTVSVGSHAFYNNTGLKTVKIGSNTTETVTISNDALRYIGKSSDPAVVTLGGTATTKITLGSTCCYNSSIKEIRFGYDAVENLTVSIGGSCFAYAYYLQTVTFGVNATTTISDSGFYDCIRLAHLTLGKSTSIGNGAFRYCHSIGTDGDLDLTSVTTVGSSAFRDCYTSSTGSYPAAKQLHSVSFGSNLTSIGSFAFYGAKYLTTVDLSNSPNLKTINPYAFTATSLESVVIPSGVETIGHHAFSSTTSGSETTELSSVGEVSNSKTLKSVTFAPNSHLKTINHYAFASQQIGSVVLPESLTTLSKWAFSYQGGSAGQQALSSVTIDSDNLTTGSYVFYNSGVKSLTLNSDKLTLGSYAFSYSKIASFTDNVTDSLTIGSYAFYNNQNLETLVINAPTVEIKDHGFYSSEANASHAYCSLKEVQIKSTSMKVGVSAFQNQMNLSVIRVPNATSATLGAYAFGSGKNDAYNDYTTFEVKNAEGETKTLNAYTGQSIFFGELDENGPVHQAFVNETNCFTGNELTIVLTKVQYPTCEEDGYMEYTITHNGTPYYMRSTMAALGHMWEGEEESAPNCVHGTHSEQYCVRGEVDPDLGVDDDGYAYGSKMEGGKKVKVAKTSVNSTTGYAVYPEGTTIANCTKQNYVDLDDNALGHYFGVGISRNVNNTASSPVTATQSMTATWDAATKSFTFNKDTIYENGSSVEYTYAGSSAFSGYKSIKVVFVCSRDNHMNEDDSTTTLESITTDCFIPIKLTGFSNQTLADIDLGINNLAWKNPAQPLAGDGGVQYYTAVYTPSTYTVSGTYEPAEIQIPIFVERVVMTLEDVTFNYTTQILNQTKQDITVNNTPTGLTPVSDGVTINNGTNDMTFAAFSTSMSTFTGTVKIAFTYHSDVYDLKTEEGTENVLTSNGYTYSVGETVTEQGRKITTIYLTTGFRLQPIALDMVTVSADSVTYNMIGHGFTLYNVPASSEITVTRVTEANGNTAVSGTGAYSNTYDVSAPTGSLTVSTDLRQIDAFSEIATDADTYHYKIVVTNNDTSFNPNSYILYTTVKVAKQPVTVPASGKVLVYNGTEQTGFADPTPSDNYVLSATQASTCKATAASGDAAYNVYLVLKNSNYVWSDGGTGTKTITWYIDKLTVQVPTFDSDKRNATYTGSEQTPLNWSAVDQSPDPSDPNKVFYKYEAAGAGNKYGIAEDAIVVYAYLSNKWVDIYYINNPRKTVTGTYTIGEPHLVSNQDTKWSGGVAPDYGTWTINQQSIATPTLTLQAVSYTGSPVDPQPTLTGSWLEYENAFDKTGFDVNANVVYYSAPSTKTTPEHDGSLTEGGAPARVGIYTAEVDLSSISDTVNYLFPNGTTAKAVLYVDKQNITLYDNSRTTGYSGGVEKVADPKTGRTETLTEYTDGTNTKTIAEYEALSPEDQAAWTPVYEVSYTNNLPDDVSFVYFEPVYETGTTTLKKDATGNYIAGASVPVSQAGQTTAGSRTLLVGIDPSCANYESIGYAVCSVTVTKADQKVVVERLVTDPDSGVVSVEALDYNETEKTYTLTTPVGAEPPVLYLRGTDPASAMTVYPAEGAGVSSGTVTYGNLQLALANHSGNNGLDATLSVNAIETQTVRLKAGETDNANATADYFMLQIVVTKATPKVTVTPVSGNYTGSAMAVSTTVQGVSYNGSGSYITPTNTTGAGITYTYYADNDGEMGSELSDAPVTVGTYWVKATYHGDSNYVETASQAVQYTISPATLTITQNLAITGAYKGSTYAVTDITSVKNGSNSGMTLTLATTEEQKSTAGYYYIMYIPDKNPGTVEATDSRWTETAPSVVDVADSGKYIYMIVAPNFTPALWQSTVTVEPVDLTVSADDTLSLTKVYDGTDSAVKKDGDGKATTTTSWTVSTAATASANSTIVAAELGDTTVTGTYVSGADYAPNTKIDVRFTLNPKSGSAFKPGNYTVNGTALTTTATDGSYITQQKSGASITKRSITINGITATTRAYDTTAKMSLAGTGITAEGFVAGESITYTLKNGYKGIVSGVTAGDYTVTSYEDGSANAVSDLNEMFTATPATGTLKDNYSVDTVTYPSATVTERQLELKYGNKTTVNGVNASGELGSLSDFTYTGAQIPSTCYILAEVLNVPTGGVAAEAVTYSFWQDAACTATPAVGTDSSVAPTLKGTYYVKATLPGTTSYYKGAVAIAKLEITAASKPTVSFTSADLAWTYDGTAHDLKNMIAGVVGTSADPTPDYTAKFYTTEADRTADTNAVTSVQNVAESGKYFYAVFANNYAVAEGDVTVTVSKKDLTITADGLVTEKVYDSTTTAAITGAAVTGAAAGETISVSAASAVYNDKTANDSKTITVTYTMDFGTALPGNYTYTAGTTATADFTLGTGVTASETVSGKITKREVNITGGITTTSRAYNGTKNIAIAGTSLTIKDGDSKDATLGAKLSDTAVGTISSADASATAYDVTVATADIVLTGADAANYTVKSVYQPTVTISRADPTKITNPDYDKVGYSGQPLTTSDYYVKVIGVQGDTDVIAQGADLTYSFWKDEACTVPAVDDSQNGATAPTNSNEDVSNNILPYYVKVNYAETTNYNAKEHKFPLTIGRTNFNMNESPVTAYTGTYDAQAHSVITSATIKSTLATDGNAGDVTGSTKVYVIAKGSETTAPATNASGWQLAYENGSATTTVQQTDAGSYSYWYMLMRDSYETTVGANAITVTISPAALTVSATVTTEKVYDAQLTAATSSEAVSGAMTGETVTITASSAYDSKTVGTGKTITTTYVLSFTGGAKASNYIVKDSAANTLTATAANTYQTKVTTGSITAKGITVKDLKPVARVYDNTTDVKLSTAAADAPKSDDICTGDTVTIGYTPNPQGTITSAKPGTYDVTVSADTIKLTGTDAGNYTVATVTPPSVTISKKQLTLLYAGQTNNSSTVNTSGTLNDFSFVGTPLNTYDAETVTGTVEGGAAAANVAYSFWKEAAYTTPAVGTDSTTAPTDVGTYYVKATLPDNDYYLGAAIVASVKITNATMSITTTPYSGTYDGSTHAPASFAITGMVGGSSQTITDYTVTFLKGTADGTAPAADSTAWNSNTVSTVKDVADSGYYYYRIVYANHSTVTGKVQVTVNSIAVKLNSTLTSPTRAYNGSAVAAITDGSVSIEAVDSAKTALVQSEITISAAAAYPGKNVAFGIDGAVADQTITTTYTLGVNGTAKLANYTLNNATLTASETRTDTGRITPKSIAVTGAKPVDFTYNADMKVTLDAANSTLTSADIETGDTVNFALDSAKNTGSAASAANADIGSRAVTVTDNAVVTLSGTDAKNYTVGSVACSNVTISAATPAFTWPTTMSMVYDGAVADSTYYAVTVTGVTGGTMPTSNVTYKFTQNTTEVSPVAVGSYTVTASIPADGNYSAHSETATLTITDSDTLSFTVNGYGTRTYDGVGGKAVTITDVKGVGSTALSSGQYTVYYSKAASATIPTAAVTDTTVWSTDATDVKNVADSGTYWYQVVAPNYSTKSDKVTVTINKKALTFSSTLTNSGEKVYDGNAAAAITDGTIAVSGIQNSETYTLTASAAYDNKNVAYSGDAVAANKTITTTYTLKFDGTALENNYSTTATVSGTGSNEWTVTETMSTGKITPKSVAISGTTATNRVYDGTKAVVLTAGSTTDFVTGDFVDIALTDGKADAATKDASASAQSVNVTLADYKLVAKTGGDDTKNYAITAVDAADSVTVTISKTEWTVTRSDVEYEYTGNAVPFDTYKATFAGVSTETPESVKYYFKLKTAADTAYSETVPTAEGSYDMKIVLAAETNYNAQTKYVTLTIKPAGLTVTMAPYSAAYDGKSHGIYSSISVTGIVGGTAGSEITGYTVKFIKAASSTESQPAADDMRWSNAAVADNKVKNVADSGNYWYCVTAENFAPKIGKLTGVSITPAPLTFTVNNLPTSKTYDGTNGVTKTGASVTVNNPNNTGEYILAGLTGASYNSEDVASATSITEGYGVTFVKCDSANYYYNGSGTNNVSGTNNDWVIIETVTATITAKPITVTIKDQTHTYNAAEPWSGNTQTGTDDTYWTVAAGALEGSDTKADLNVALTKAAGTAVGEYAISGAWNNSNYAVTFAGNYTGDTTKGKFSITAQGLTIKIGNTEGFYGDDPVLTKTLLTDTAGNNAYYGTGESIATIQALFGTENGKIHLKTDAVKTSDVSSATVTYKIYAANDSGEEISNGFYGGYSITFVNGVYTQKQRPVTITVKDATTTYDSVIPDFQYEITSATGMAAGDTLTVSFTTNAVHDETSTPNLTSDVGSYYIEAAATAKNGSAADMTGNYAFTYVGSYTGGTKGTYTITKADLVFWFAKAAVGAPGGVEYSGNQLLFKVNTSGGRMMNADNGNAFDGTVKYSSKDTSIATVDADTGAVMPLSDGDFTEIVATISNSANYNIPTENTTEYTLSVSGVASVEASVSAVNAEAKVLNPNVRGSLQNQDLVSVNVTNPAGGTDCTVQYSVDGGAWSTEVPQRAEAGSYIVAVKVSHAGMNDFEATVTAVIRALPSNTVRFNGNGGTTGSAETSVTRTIQSGYNLMSTDFPAFTLNGYDLKDWSEAISGETKTAADWIGTTVTGNMALTANWQINAQASSLTVTVTGGTQRYDGTEKTPALQVMSGSTPLTAGQYVAVYSNNVNATNGGTKASVSVTGVGSYAGFTGSAEFEILKGIQTVTFEEDALSVTYAPGSSVANAASAAMDAANATITYSIDRSDYASINSATGVVTPIVAKTVKITATAAATANMEQGSASYTLIVNKADPALHFANSFYSVRVIDGTVNNTLTVEPSTLTVTYSSNDPNVASVNSATGLVTLKGEGSAIITASTAANDCYNAGSTYFSIATQNAIMDKDIFYIQDYYGVYDGNEHTIQVKKADAAAVKYSLEDNGASTVYTDTNPGFRDAGTYTVYYKIEAAGYVPTTGEAKVVINPAPLTSAVNSATIVYSGAPQLLSAKALTVKANELTVDARDYSVSYANNINAGTATAVVTARAGSNYTGTTTCLYTINPADITNVVVQPIGEQSYTGKEITPKIQLANMTEGKDFTVSYADNVNVTSGAKVTIYGVGNYAGQVVKTFSIVNGVTIRLIVDNTVKTYNGGAQSASILVVDSEGKELTEGVDYTVTGNSATDVGTYPIQITGINNYQGKTDSGSFSISAASLESMTLGSFEPVTYTGTAFEPAVALAGLTAADYEVSYSGNVNAGTATVTVTGKGNYTGKLTGSFVIRPKTLDSTAIESVPDQIRSGNAIEPKLTVKDGSVVLAEGRDYTVSYSSNVEAGTATAEVSYCGNYKGSGSVSFVIKANAADLSIAPMESKTYTGNEIKPEPAVSYNGTPLTKGTDFSYSYSSNKNAGTATVTVTGLGTYAGITGSKTFLILPASIAAQTVTPIAEQSYTGSAVTPAVIISGLTQDKDYTVAYSNNLNVGSATVTITGHGNYTGTTSVNFTIKSKGTAVVPTVAPATIPDQTYTGSQIKPVLTIKANGDVLEEVKDYTVAYGENKAIGTGTGTVTVTFKGNYAGAAQINMSFNIVASASDFTAALEKDSFVFDGTEKQVSVTVKYGGNTLVAGQDYTLSGTTATDAGSYTVTVHGAGNYSKFTRFLGWTVKPAAITSEMLTVGSGYTYTGALQTAAVTVSAPAVAADYTVLGASATDAGTYTVTVVGRNNYTGSAEKEFTVEPASILSLMAGVGVEDQVYTGKALTPDVTLTFAGKRLAAGADYTLTHSNNTAVGTADVEVTGIGNFKDTSTLHYSIKANTTALMIDAVAAQTYTGSDITPTLRVTYAGVELDSANYVVVYSGNRNVGMATATVTGKSGSVYDGLTGSVNFQIMPADINTASVTAIADQTYTGSAHTPAVTVIDLAENVDFAVVYSNNVSAGSAVVTLIGMGNYTGVKTTGFNITAKALDAAAVEAIPDQTYTCSAIEPAVIVKDGSKYLALGTDYTVTYANNEDVGNNASATVTFIGNYSGSAAKSFSILAKAQPVSVFTVSTDLTAYTWTGNAIVPVVTVLDNGAAMASPADYTVNYYNAEGTPVTSITAVGSYRIEAVGAGNYSGVLGDTVITVVPAVPGASFAQADVNKSYGDAAFVNTLYTVSEGTVYFSSAAPAVASVNPATGEVTVNGVGVAVITASIAADGSYTAASAAFTLTVTPKDITGMSIGTIGDQTYTGSAIEPAVTVGGLTAADFDVTYENNTEVGTATVTVTAKGNYSGSTSTTFEIVSKALTVGEIAPVTYTGSAIEPTLTVKCGNTVLGADEYEAVYSNNTAAGIAGVTVTGKGEYAGLVADANFTITKAAMSTATIAPIAAQTYTGSAIEPAVTVSFNGTTLVKGVDYTVIYGNNVEKGSAAEAKITALPGGSLTGSCTVYFTIQAGGGGNTPAGPVNPTPSTTKKDLSDAEIKVDDAVYDGKPVTPKTIVTLDGEVLEEDADYVLSYANNNAVGTGRVTVTGIGKYNGEQTASFSIKERVVYTDVAEDAWYKDAVDYVTEKGYMTGIGDNKFDPSGSTTRGAIITILYRMEGEPEYTRRHSFKDTAEGSWYDEAVSWGTENGIILGFDENTFGPEINITREQIAAIFYRYATYKKYGTAASADLSKFSDSELISSWADESMTWANGVGLINGKTESTINPQDQAIRAEVATMIMRLCEDLKILG